MNLSALPEITALMPPETPWLMRRKTRSMMLPSSGEGNELTQNMFGDLTDLSSEATVEQFFVNRLLAELGYSDSQIKPKASLAELTLSRGRKTVKWRPDYALVVDKQVRWICEAKGVDENLDDWVGQASSYCLELNSQQADDPVEFFVLTNGVTTRLYRWNQRIPIIEASFSDFTPGSVVWEDLRDILAPARLPQPSPDIQTRHTLRRHSVGELNADFAWAHRLIHRREALNYTAAFMEFVKIVFLKLRSDREAHASLNLRHEEKDVVSVPADEVRFSTAWISASERDTPNPLDETYFRRLVDQFEKQIIAGKMKRIFEPNERINLSPETIKALVARLEHVDLISIDADLNGRMFETFLNTTLRGKDLGQFFTPRSVVKLATGLAQLKAGPDHIDRVIDACSGTGGFLIEALTDMRQQIMKRASLTDVEKKALLAELQDSLIGVDVARDPALARIARINMYLHEDTGTSIYQLDALDKKVRVLSSDSHEIGREKDEFRARVEDGKRLVHGAPRGLVDVVLTNPPFAKEYNRKESSEAELLDLYDLAFETSGGRRRPLQKLSSMLMFLERYYDMLPPGGRLVTVLDDGILGSANHERIRDWIRQNWIIKAVVSLPGDAFQRSQARVKTSILILEKKRTPDEQQADAFMYYCSIVGVDDSPRQRTLPIDELNRAQAKQEITDVIAAYEAFQAGDPSADRWRVPADRLNGRLDVKSCIARPGVRIPDWEAQGFEIRTVDDMLELAVGVSGDEVIGASRLIDTRTTDELVTYLRVRYDGFCELGDEVLTSDIASAATLTRVEAGDIVFSHINAIHGAVGIVPAELAGAVVTNEYTVCRAKAAGTERAIWTLLRSPQARADLLILATGIGRTRVRWAEIKHLTLPWPDAESQQKLHDALTEADRTERAAFDLRAEARGAAEQAFGLDSVDAHTIISAFKPPR